MRIAVMGAGGVGGYFGGRLAQAGHEVTFIARGRHLEALQAKGLTLKSPLGDANLKVKAVGNAADAGPAEIVLFAVKLWDTEESASQLRPVVAQGGHVLPTRIRVESRDRGTTTEVWIRDLRINPELDPRLFSVKTLQSRRPLPVRRK